MPTVSWVTLEVDAPNSPIQADTPVASDLPPDDAVRAEGDREGPGEETSAPDHNTGAGIEVGLCPECLSSARARGRLLAPVIPLRPGHRRRRRASD